jgi:hypothetical protein
MSGTVREAIPLLDTGGDLWRVRSVPRDRSQHADRPAELAQALSAAILPALLSEHATGGPVLVGWLHQDGDTGIRLLLGGGTGPGRPARQPLYPPGATGTRVAAADVARELRGYPHWTRCSGVIDVLAKPDPREPPAPTRTVFDDYVSALLGQAFAWLVLAEPVGPDELASRLSSLARRVPMLHDAQGTSEARRIELERARTRYRELSRAQICGLWQVHLLAGAERPADATRIGGLLGAAADLAAVPYRVVPGRVVADLDTVWHGRQVDTDGPGSPFEVPSDVLAILGRPPVRELPGLRVVDTGDFDTTPELTEGLPLGRVLDRGARDSGPLTVSTRTLNRHTLVCGATGSGKSQTVRTILESLAQQGIPWLVIEPAKAEYAGMAGRLAPDGEVLVLRPGDPEAVPAGLNPLEPEPGFPLQTHLDLVRALFLAAFEPHEPLPQILSRSLARSYELVGWDLALSEPRVPGIQPRYPTLADLRNVASRVIDEIGYGAEIASNVRGFMDVRIGSLLLGTPGRFFAGGHPLDIADLLGRNTVLELEDIGNDQDKAFFIGTVLVRIVEHLRRRRVAGDPGGTPGKERLRHVTVIEEAHRLLKATERESPARYAVELFAGLLAEIRAYGEGIIVAEQIPSKIAPDVVKNTALKIMHRLPAEDDRRLVGAAMNLREHQSEYVVTLAPGTAAVFADGMDRPILARMPYREDCESTEAAVRRPGLAGRRSEACGTGCQARPCTLRELSRGTRTAADAQLGLWIEVLAAAHVLGRVAPGPQARWLAHAAALAGERTLDCAIAQLVDAAANSRYPALVAYYRPEELARHLAGSVRAVLAGQPGCEQVETGWQAGPFRWQDVFFALQDPGCDPDRPHPLTAAWRARGLDLTGLDARDQLVALSRLPSVTAIDWTAVEGAGRPPRHAELAAGLSRSTDPGRRFAEAAWFLPFRTDWPIRLLVRPDRATNEGA